MKQIIFLVILAVIISIANAYQKCPDRANQQSSKYFRFCKCTSKQIVNKKIHVYGGKITKLGSKITSDSNLCKAAYQSGLIKKNNAIIKYRTAGKTCGFMKACRGKNCSKSFKGCQLTAYIKSSKCKTHYKNKKSSKKVCKRERGPSRWVKKHKYVTKRLPYVVKVKKYKKVKKCKIRRKRVKVRKAVKGTKRQKYTKKHKKKRYYNKRVSYIKKVKKKYRVQKTKSYYVTKNHSKKVRKTFYRTETKVKKYTVACKKKTYKTYYVKESRPYKTTCKRKYSKIAYKNKKVWKTKIVKRKWFTGKYQKSRGKANCFQKVYKMKPYKKRYRANKRVAYKKTYYKKVKCTKSRKVSVKKTKVVMKNGRCKRTKNVKKRVPYKKTVVVRWKTKTKKYKKYYVTKTKMVPVKKWKTVKSWKWHFYTKTHYRTVKTVRYTYKYEMKPYIYHVYVKTGYYSNEKRYKNKKVKVSYKAKELGKWKTVCKRRQVNKKVAYKKCY